MYSKIVVAAALVAGANAACPNSCSGHGSCGASEVCTCYDGWGTGGAIGGDCSDRFCPSELAWVDAPDKNGYVHKYAECAGKGICDRELGQCECFAGYEGKGCGRQVCPDSCSGHGTCEFANELTFGTVFNGYFDGAANYQAVGVGATKIPDYSWDGAHSRACACDAGWAGVNCGQRQCPEGNDPIDTRADTSDTLVHQVQTIRLISGGPNDAYATNSTSKASLDEFVDKSFALRFTSQNGEAFSTRSIAYGNAGAATAGYVNYATEPTEVCVGTALAGQNIKRSLCNDYFADQGAATVAAITAAVNGGSNIDAEALKYINEHVCTAGGTVVFDASMNALATALSGTYTAATVATACATYNNFDKTQSLAMRIKDALLDLPNKVVDGVEVSVHRTTPIEEAATAGTAGLKIGVTFTGNAVHGNQHLLEVIVDSCGDGCTPRVDGLDTLALGTADMSSVKQTTSADYNSYECGRRGKCDVDTGVCTCFAGFTGESCSSMSALA